MVVIINHDKDENSKSKNPSKEENPKNEKVEDIKDKYQYLDEVKITKERI